MDDPAQSIKQSIIIIIIIIWPRQLARVCLRVPASVPLAPVRTAVIGPDIREPGTSDARDQSGNWTKDLSRPSCKKSGSWASWGAARPCQAQPYGFPAGWWVSPAVACPWPPEFSATEQNRGTGEQGLAPRPPLPPLPPIAGQWWGSGRARMANRKSSPGFNTEAALGVSLSHMRRDIYRPSS